jgi:hypothetical protein
VLRALSPEDAALADHLLAEHVPTCDRCRATLREFTELGGDIALAARAVEPPELLLPRLRQAVGGAPEPVVPRRRSPFGWTAAVAAAVVVGLATWNTVALDNRVSSAEQRERKLAGAMQLVADPMSRKVPLGPRRAPRATRLIAAYVPGREEMSVVGSGIPEPGSGHVYRLWLVHPGGSTRWVGDFHPDSGFVALYFYVDLAGYSGMLISEENGPTGPQPAGTVRWATALTAP